MPKRQQLPSGRNAAFLAARAEFRSQCKAIGAPCWICEGDLGPIDYTAPPNDTLAFELDHLYPVSQRPDLAYERALWRPSHCSCNRRRGAKSQAAVVASRAPTPHGEWTRPAW